LTAKFREGVRPYLDITLKTTSQALKDRLLETICLRQQNFAFLRSRRVSRDTEGTEVIPKSTQQVPQTRSRLGSAYSVKSRLTNQSQRTSEPSRPRKSKTRGAPPSATTLNTNRLPVADPKLEKPDMEYSLADLPRRPKISPSKRDLECPYCFLVCSVREFTESEWPYVYCSILKDLHASAN
jgi:hypothetical protein